MIIILNLTLVLLLMYLTNILFSLSNSNYVYIKENSKFSKITLEELITLKVESKDDFILNYKILNKSREVSIPWFDHREYSFKNKTLNDVSTFNICREFFTNDEIRLDIKILFYIGITITSILLLIQKSILISM